MKNNKKADTIAGIIIAIFILSFALLGIVNVLDFNESISDNYGKETDLYILKSNSENILKNIDIKNVAQDEKFYIYKNNVTKEFQVLTGAINEKYKYINKNGDYVDPITNTGKTFIREYEKKIDILRHDTSPVEINNLIFHFDANNIDGTNNSSLINGSTISVWKDLAIENGEQNAVDKSTIPMSTQYTSNLPTYNSIGLNSLPMVEFNGTDEMLAMNLNNDINNDGDCFSQKYYMEKSFALVFQTGNDINSSQVIYEQGGDASGYNIMIENGDIWAGVHNITTEGGYSCTGYSGSDSNFYFEWDSLNKYKSVNLGGIMPNTIYFLIVVQDSTHINRTNTNIIDDIKEDYTTHDKYIDDQNRFKIYLNGILVSEIDHIDPLPEHSYGALGNIYRGNINPVNQSFIDDISQSNKAYFKGGIGEIISRNHALNENEIVGVKNYFSQKWFGSEKSIRYDVVNTILKEFKDF